MTEPKRDEAPLPWHFVGQIVNGGRVHTAIEDANGMTVAMFPVYRANSDAERAGQRRGQRIVRAVNNESLLREALRDLLLKYVDEMHGDDTCDCDPSVGIESCAPCVARAALAASEHP